jgi:hypothetical protein
MCDGTVAAVIAADAAAVAEGNRWHKGGDRIYGYLSCFFFFFLYYAYRSKISLTLNHINPRDVKSVKVFAFVYTLRTCHRSRRKYHFRSKARFTLVRCNET